MFTPGPVYFTVLVSESRETMGTVACTPMLTRGEFWSGACCSDPSFVTLNRRHEKERKRVGGEREREENRRREAYNSSKSIALTGVLVLVSLRSITESPIFLYISTLLLISLSLSPPSPSPLHTFLHPETKVKRTHDIREGNGVAGFNGLGDVASKSSAVFVQCFLELVHRGDCLFGLQSPYLKAM